MSFAGYIRLAFLILLVHGSINTVRAQHVYIPFNDYTYHLADRYSILTASPFFTAFRPFRRDEVVDPLFLRTKEEGGVMSEVHQNFFQTDNPFESNNNIGPAQALKFWKRFYRSPNALIAFREGGNYFQLNPVLGLSGGASNDDLPFQNSRGFTFRGSIDGKIGFYSYITENQMRFPRYYSDFIRSRSAIPGYGFHKGFGKDGYDFFNARAYITFRPVKPIQVLFGHDKLFVGNGYRSLVWSDHAKEHLMLRVHTHIGRMHYHNVFSELNDLDYLSGSGDGVQKKYSAFHYLGLDLIPGKLNLGFFEQIIFQRLDSNGVSRGFDPNYLNPVIFYRAIEHGLNSSDNALLGMDFKWNFLNRFSLYGQVVLDEFVKKEMFRRTGWWGNKWALQTGVKWINVLNVPQLDLQLEANWVRPYTYSHSSDGLTATHYNQALAHPLGANFREQLVVVRYQPLAQWNVRAFFMHAFRGLDGQLPGSPNYGSDITKTYAPANRPFERGIRIGDGIPEKLNMVDFMISYRFFHNMFWDYRLIYRSSTGNSSAQNTWFIGTGIRINLDVTRYDF